MLNIIKGDIFNSKDKAIAHGCNCFNAMGKGIAVHIKRIYPEAYEIDQATKKGDRKKLGTFSFVDYINDPKSNHDIVVYNLYSQYTYWNKSDMFYIESFNRALRDACIHAANLNINTISIPAIGLGLANGKIQQVYDVILECSRIIDINLYLIDSNMYTRMVNLHDN